MMNLWDGRAKTKIVTVSDNIRLAGDDGKRYRRAEWTMFTDRGDWRIGVRVRRKYGDAEINLPMVQFVREPWYDKEPK